MTTTSSYARPADHLDRPDLRRQRRRPRTRHWLARYGCTRHRRREGARAARPAARRSTSRARPTARSWSRMGILDEMRRPPDRHGPTRPSSTRTATARRSSSGEFTGGDIEILRGDLARAPVRAHARTLRVRLRRLDHLAHRDRRRRARHLRARARPARSTWSSAPTASTPTSAGSPSAPSRATCASSATTTPLRLPNDLGVDRTGRAVQRARPDGRVATTAGPEGAGVLLSSPPSSSTTTAATSEQQKRILARAYAGMGWRIPGRWTALRGRRRLLLRLDQPGPRSTATPRAAWCCSATPAYGDTLGGFGTGLAIVGAYVLAGELAAAGGDHRTAFAALRGADRGLRQGLPEDLGQRGPLLRPAHRAEDPQPRPDVPAARLPPDGRVLQAPDGEGRDRARPEGLPGPAARTGRRRARPVSPSGLDVRRSGPSRPCWSRAPRRPSPGAAPTG